MRIHRVSLILVASLLYSAGCATFPDRGARIWLADQTLTRQQLYLLAEYGLEGIDGWHLLLHNENRQPLSIIVQAIIEGSPVGETGKSITFTSSSELIHLGVGRFDRPAAFGLATSLHLQIYAYDESRFKNDWIACGTFLLPSSRTRNYIGEKGLDFGQVVELGLQEVQFTPFTVSLSENRTPVLLPQDGPTQTL